MSEQNNPTERQLRAAATAWTKAGFSGMQAGYFLPGLQGLFFGPRWSRERLRRNQCERLRSLVRHACREIPFYRELYRGHGVGPEDIRDLGDLQRLPVTSRQDLQRFGKENLRARGLRPGKIFTHWTSGSTGEPLRVWRTKSEEWLLAAFRLRSLLQYGVRPGERMASVQFLPEADRPFRKPGLLMRMLFPHLEIHCLLDSNDILKALKKFKPEVLAGIPPILDRICEKMEAGGWPEIRPRMIITGAEPLTSRIRDQLSRQFGVPVFDRYSAVECRLIASSCPRIAERYHICEDAVLVEVIKDGRTAKPGEEGEILITALHSYAMPFIRYRLGDLVRLEEESCPCGSPYTTLSAICGRQVDRLIKADGSEIHIPVIVQILPELAPWIRRYQIVQRVPGRITIEVLSGRDPGRECMAATLRSIADRIAGLEVSFEFRPDIPVEAAGKFRLFRSEIAGMKSGST